MGTNAIFFAWNRSIPGREPLSRQHFEDFTKYLETLKGSDTIEGYDVMFLMPHGGDMNGFFLIKGEPGKLDDLMATEGWLVHMIRAGMHLENSGAIRGHTGDMVPVAMEIWSRTIPE